MLVIREERHFESENMTAAIRPNQSADAHALWRKDHDHLIHPFTHFPTFEKEGALVIAKGEGAYVFDADGKQLMTCAQESMLRRIEPTS